MKSDEIKNRSEEIDKALDSGLRERLMKYPNVFHVASGLKHEGGTLIKKACIRVYVKEKIPKEKLTKDQIVPKEIDGFETDINIVSTIDFATDNGTYRPVIGGIQITNGITSFDGLDFKMHSGTLGCIATHVESDDEVLLTNWHVLSRNGGTEDDGVFQPRPRVVNHSILDSYPKRPTSNDNRIATIKALQVDTNIDAAIATIDTCYSLCCNCGIEPDNEINLLQIGGKDFIRSKAAAANGQTVFKVGKTTGRTEGTVVTTNYPSFDIERDGTTYTFTGQIEIEHVDGNTHEFSSSGDSGSVIITDQGAIIGLLFASGKTEVSPGNFEFLTLANHIDLVESGMGISVNLTPVDTDTTSGAMITLPKKGRHDASLFEEFRKEFTETDKGKVLWDMVRKRSKELVYLINHNRNVLVTWHRNQGPAYLACILKNIRKPSYRIPQEIKGITLLHLLQQMGDCLMIDGSKSLQDDILEWRTFILEKFGNTTDVRNIIIQMRDEIHEC